MINWIKNNVELTIFIGGFAIAALMLIALGIWAANTGHDVEMVCGVGTDGQYRCVYQ